jgi:threonine/homoserine/homoserine lactone efflux protein
MGQLLAQVVPLALGAAVSPLVFAVQLATLTGPRRLARGSMVAAGAAVPLIGVAVLMLAFGRAIRLPKLSAATLGTTDIVFGIVLLLLGLRALLRPRATKESGAKKPRGTSLGASFGAGVGMMLSNFTTIALFIPAMKIVAESGLDAAEVGAATVIVLLITLIPALVPLALTAAVPKTSGRVLTATGDWLGEHRRWITVVLGLGFGAYLVIHGIARY